MKEEDLTQFDIAALSIAWIQIVFIVSMIVAIH